jgi:cytidine deaminase
MTFEAIYNIALEVANARAQSGEYIAPDETICVICSRTGRVYNGVSHMGVHAEIEAMRNMQTYGNEVAVESMVLIATISRSPMLPCTGCINYIISMSPENSMGCVVMPDRMIPLSEMLGMGGGYAPNTAFSGMPNGMPAAAPVQSGYMSGQFVQSVQFGSAAPVPSSPLTSSMTSSQYEGGNGGTAKNDLLKSRVSSLMSAAENDDEEDAEFLEELGAGKKKKGLFGLFG